MNALVLIVDDDDANLVVCEAALGDALDVVTAQSGARALEILTEREVAVLVTDQRMPGMTGVELCERVRDLSPDTIRILITAYSDLKAAIDAINRGQVRRYLRKPWEPEELLTEIRDAIDVYQMHHRLREAEQRLRRTEQIYAMGVAAAGLSHEIRNPLSWIANNFSFVSEAIGELKQDGAAGAIQPAQFGAKLCEIEEALADLGEGVQRLKGVVENMEPWSRRAPDPDDDVDLADVTRLSLRLMDHQLRRSASLVVSSGGTAVVRGSSAKLNQVVVNLLANAVQAFGDRPREHNRVSVAVGQDDGRAYVEVADNGPGVPAPIEGRIFEPFFTTKGEQGTGLGLAICQRIAREHGGDIRFRRREGGGACFRLTLPLKG